MLQITSLRYLYSTPLYISLFKFAPHLLALHIIFYKNIMMPDISDIMINVIIQQHVQFVS